MFEIATYSQMADSLAVFWTVHLLPSPLASLGCKRAAFCIRKRLRFVR